MDSKQNQKVQIVTTKSIVNLKDSLGYSFKNEDLLKQALTHRSFSKKNYERLEFLGDGILDHVIALNLYNKFDDLSEGELSKIRAALVNQDALVAIANKIHLGHYLLLGDGEEKSGGRKRDSILADSMEAIFAAVSLDSSFECARLVVEKLYAESLDNIDQLITKDNKSLLQEYLQKQKISVPTYEIIESIGPDHDSIFSVLCTVHELGIKASAKGKSKKEASQLAALKILTELKERDKRGR
jgi:ribonuclease III